MRRGDNPFPARQLVVTCTTFFISTTVRLRTWIRTLDARIDRWLQSLADRHARRLALAVVVLALLAPRVAAQSAASDAASAMCQTGLGGLLTFVLGMITVGLVLIAAFRGMVAWNNLGSARKDKKQRGRDQLKGAGITLSGAFAPPIFGVALDKAGINTLSCVDFGNIMMIGVHALP